MKKEQMIVIFLTTVKALVPIRIVIDDDNIVCICVSAQLSERILLNLH